jgi:seryl-tRNA synthetase
VSVEDEIAALRSRMETTSRELKDRAELSTKKIDQVMAEGKEKSDKALKTAAAVATRLHERAASQKAAGGWGTAAATTKKTGEFDIGVEDDEEETDDLAAYRQATALKAPPPPAPEPAPTPPATPAWAPAGGRTAATRRPQRATQDDDDFGSQSWLS